MSAAPGRDDLDRLARKYRQIAELRRARARGEPIPERAVFRALAEEFPGALKELDTLPIEVIDARLEALLVAGAGAEPWIVWMIDYHALMRAALYLKIRLARLPDLPTDQAEALAARASAHARVAVGAAFVAAVRSPPSGRITRVVYAELAARHSAPEEEIRTALFPRRPDPDAKA